VDLEEVGADEVVVRITATPTRPADGPQLAREIVQALVPYAAGASDNEQVFGLVPLPAAASARHPWR
jgi:hypothetical protein